jgi:hypothetical protein
MHLRGAATIIGLLLASIELTHIMKVFENKVLRRIFAPKKEEATEKCRKLHNLYPSPNFITVLKPMRMDGLNM